MSSSQPHESSDIVRRTHSKDEIRRNVPRSSTVVDVDREIIRALQRNGRTSNTEIGRALGLTETTIRKRIARLADDELVHGVAVPTPRAVGATLSAIIGISVKLGDLDTVSEAVSKAPEVRYV